MDLKQLTNGKNIETKEIKRGYLRQDELNNFLMIFTVAQLIEGTRSVQHKKQPPMWETWESSGIITKEQRKNLKMALTYMKKFSSSVFNDNLDVKTKENVLKKNVKWEFKLIDDYTVQKIYSMIKNIKEVQLTLDEFYDMVDASLYVRCRNCSKDRNECTFRDFLEDKMVPKPNDGECPNCEYAYKE